LTQVVEQSKQTEAIKNHFTTFTLLAFLSVLKEIHGQNSIFTQLFALNPVSSPQKPSQQRQDDARQHARRDGKVKAEIAALVGNIAGQSPQPAQAAPRPKPRSYNRDDDPHDKK